MARASSAVNTLPSTFSPPTHNEKRVTEDSGGSGKTYIPSTVNLTARQAEMKKYIEEYFAEHGYAPSYREIMKQVGIPSLSVVRYNLDRLQREGILDRDPRVARGIRPHMAQLRSIRVWGYIAAGEPMPVPG